MHCKIEGSKCRSPKGKKQKQKQKQKQKIAAVECVKSL